MDRAKQIMTIQHHNNNVSWSLTYMQRIKLQFDNGIKGRKVKIYLKCFKIPASTENVLKILIYIDS